MKFFKSMEKKLSYKDVLQLDGAYSETHMNYNKSPVFNGAACENSGKISRKNNSSSKENATKVIEGMTSFDGAEKSLKKDNPISLWENYWLEYINAFDKLISCLPNSVVTAFVGRQAIEIGFKYLLLKNNGKLITTHDLKELSSIFFKENTINDLYMECVDVFCEKFCEEIEVGKAEYFRYPEYKNGTYFAGNHLDLEWLSYNFALILLKLLHFAGLDND